MPISSVFLFLQKQMKINHLKIEIDPLDELFCSWSFCQESENILKGCATKDWLVTYPHNHLELPSYPSASIRSDDNEMDASDPVSFTQDASSCG